jgi:histidine triad (HIT) family protein
MPDEEECIFCRIVAGAVPASIVARTDLAFAFMDINQPNPGHVLIIPTAHYRDLYDLPEADAHAVFSLTMLVAKAVKRALAADGMNLIQANERAGQQDVFHFHMHVLARFAGDRDRIRLGWSPALPARGELDDLAARISAAL